MILEFSVGNFRSFGPAQSLAFRASSDKSHEASHCVPTRFSAVPRVLRTAALFGPNGAGKSNLLRALRTMRELVVHSCDMTQEQFSALYTPFGLSRPDGEPTTFTIDLLLAADIRYRYSFSYDHRRVVKETLHVYRLSKSQRWFERSINSATGNETWTPFAATFVGPRDAWRRATQPHALFLSTASRRNAAVLKPLTHWFEHQLQIALSDDVAQFGMFAKRLQEAPFKTSVLHILRAVDLPIADVRVSDAGDSATPSVEFLYQNHRMAPQWVDSEHISAGAERLILLLAHLLGPQDADRFLAIDDFDAHLHALTARFLVKLVDDPGAVHRTGQVLFVSHCPTLMDIDILRRDEIWLMTANDDGESILGALTEHAPRLHSFLASAYMQGRFGALPNIGP